MQISMTNLKIWVTIISAISKAIRNMNGKLEPCIHQDLKFVATTVRSMDIELLSVDLSLCGHQTNQKRQEIMDISTIGTTTLGRDVTIVKSTDTSLRIA